MMRFCARGHSWIWNEWVAEGHYWEGVGDVGFDAI